MLGMIAHLKDGGKELKGKGRSMRPTAEKADSKKQH